MIEWVLQKVPDIMQISLIHSEHMLVLELQIMLQILNFGGERL